MGEILTIKGGSAFVKINLNRIYKNRYKILPKSIVIIFFNVY
jgi:hypothetical protein